MNRISNGRAVFRIERKVGRRGRRREMEDLQQKYKRKCLFSGGLCLCSSFFFFRD
jgi:hypothetical protein